MISAIPILDAVATALITSSWQVAGLTAAAWLAFALLARRSAALRHTIGMVFLMACVAALAVTFFNVLVTPATLMGDRFDLGTIAPPMLIVWLWGAGVALKLAQFASAWIAFRGLEQRAWQPLPSQLRSSVARLTHCLGIARPVSVRLVADVLPCSARLLRPVIWLPASLLSRLSADQIEAILAHELAHVRRLDWLWNGLQCAVDVMLFYHPCLWWLSRRVHQEREHACDDLAVAACGNPIVFAEALGSLEAMRAPNLVLSAQGGLSMKRISRLLMPEPGPPARWTVPLASLTLLGLGAILALQSQTASANRDTPRWWQGHGDAITLGAQVGPEQRRYMRWHDANGQVRERFVINGQAKAIDATARKWINAAAIMPAPPPPPPVMPAIAPMPPIAPMSVDPAYAAAVEALRRAPGMQAITTIRLDGPSHIASNSAKLTLDVEGPNGTKRLNAIRDAQASDWRFEPARAEQ